MGAYDNLPDSLQESEQGWKMDEILCDLDNATDVIDELIDGINDVIER